jgi:hypothetical protein
MLYSPQVTKIELEGNHSEGHLLVSHSFYIKTIPNPLVEREGLVL